MPNESRRDRESGRESKRRRITGASCDKHYEVMSIWDEGRLSWYQHDVACVSVIVIGLSRDSVAQHSFVMR